jgi:hypothetical protein
MHVMTDFIIFEEFSQVFFSPTKGKDFLYQLMPGTFTLKWILQERKEREVPRVDPVFPKSKDTESPVDVLRSVQASFKSTLRRGYEGIDFKERGRGAKILHKLMIYDGSAVHIENRTERKGNLEVDVKKIEETDKMIKSQAEEMKKIADTAIVSLTHQNGKLFREMPYNAKSAQHFTREHQDLAALDRKFTYSCHVCNIDHGFQLQRGRADGDEDDKK